MIRLLLPAYNEEAALEPLVRKFDAELKRMRKDYEILVMDDGSTDRTAEIAKELRRSYALSLIKHPRNLGLGATMRDGLNHLAKHADDDDLIVTMDCDDTHDPRYLEAAVKKIREGHDVVILSRYQEGGGEKGLSTIKSLLSRGAGLFLKLFFPIRGVREYSGGYRVLRASALKRAMRLFGEDFVRLDRWGFVVTAEILVKLRLAGCRITETPFVLRYDQKPGRSKNRPLKTIAGYFALVAMYWGRKPVHP